MEGKVLLAGNQVILPGVCCLYTRGGGGRAVF